MARNPLTRGGKRWAIEFSNLKEAQARFTKVSEAVSGVSGVRANSAAAGTIAAAFAQISEFLRDRIKSAAAGKNAPRRVQAAVFAFSDLSRGSTARKRRSALVGIRKGAPPRNDSRLFVTWSGGGKSVGMSLSTIFNKGTSRGIKPGRFFQAGLAASRSYVLNRLTAAYKAAIESFN